MKEDDKEEKGRKRSQIFGEGGEENEQMIRDEKKDKSE